jgi:phosphoribosylformimino-5-aminoimidazole carboxamide ribotide isomerase
MTARPELIPAVDILAGRAVRLHQGRYDQVIAWRADPDALVDTFVAAGARTVHLVNLDGARDGGVDVATIGRIAARYPATSFQVAGGVRSMADVDALLAAGAARVCVGTAALEGGEALEAYTATYGPRLVLSLDVRGGRLATRGWLASSDIGLDTALAAACDARCPVMLTAIERDGSAQGPDLDLVRSCAPQAGFLIAAGGVRRADDVDALGVAGADAVVAGRALLDGTLPMTLWS